MLRTSLWLPSVFGATDPSRRADAFPLTRAAIIRLAGGRDGGMDRGRPHSRQFALAVCRGKLLSVVVGTPHFGKEVGGPVTMEHQLARVPRHDRGHGLGQHDGGSPAVVRLDHHGAGSGPAVERVLPGRQCLRAHVEIKGYQFHAASDTLESRQRRRCRHPILSPHTYATTVIYFIRILSGASSRALRG